jgi:hypothetical protein
MFDRINHKKERPIGVLWQVCQNHKVLTEELVLLLSIL